jgi:hypothetical protein
MKEYTCIELKHHKEIAKTLEEYQKQGWRLNTYQVAGIGMGGNASHYLLLEKDSGK